MLNKFQFVSLIILAMSFLANCAPKNNPSPAANPQTPDAAPVQHNVVTNPIKLVKMNGLVSKDSISNIDLSGTGTDTKYLARFSFNSGNNTAFKILKQTLSSTCSGSLDSLHDARLRLITGTTIVEHDLSDATPLDRNTDYVLEVELGQHHCSTLHSTIGILAWADNSDVNVVHPNLAKYCRAENASFSNLTVFVTTMPFSGLASNQSAFLDSDVFCGQRGDLYDEQSEMTATSSHTVNKTEQGESFMADVSFDENGGGSISCAKNGKSFASVSLASCIDEVADLEPLLLLQQHRASR